MIRKVFLLITLLYFQTGCAYNLWQLSSQSEIDSEWIMDICSDRVLVGTTLSKEASIAAEARVNELLQSKDLTKSHGCVVVSNTINFGEGSGARVSIRCIKPLQGKLESGDYSPKRYLIDLSK